MCSRFKKLIFSFHCFPVIIHIPYYLVIIVLWLQISGPGRKENQFFRIFKPSFRCVHWVGGKHFKPKSSKPCWASWLLLRAWSVLAGIWILPEWFSAWLSSHEGWAQQTIVLEQPCEDCPWICKGIRVSEASFFSMNIKQASQPFFLDRQGNPMNFQVPTWNLFAIHGPQELQVIQHLIGQWAEPSPFWFWVYRPYSQPGIPGRA